MQLPKLEPRAALRTSRRLVVKLAAAPDGLPMVLSVDRGRPPESILLPIARSLGAGDDPAQWTGHLRELAVELVRKADATQFFDADNGSGKSTTYYLCRGELRGMLGPTLLERLAGDTSQPVGHAPAISGFSNGTHINYGTVSHFLDHADNDTDGAVGELVHKHEAMTSSKFALDTASDAVAIARAPKDGTGAPLVERPFVEESVHFFDTARFKLVYDDATIAEGKFGKEYADARAEYPNPGHRWVMELKMRDLMRMAVGLAKELGEMHGLGLVHADVKPANVLVSRSGPKAIDSLDVPVGELSPGLTRGYAAPEQILGEPVGPGTDQYAFAVMMAQLLGGMLYGKESTFVVPVGPNRTERFTLLESPSVYLDVESTRLPREAIRAVRTVLERCLRFRPEERFPSIGDVGDAFMQLVESHGLFASRSAAIRFGDIARVNDDGVAWVLRDRH